MGMGYLWDTFWSTIWSIILARVQGVVTVSAKTIYGAMHGLETVTQLVAVHSTQSASLQTIPYAPVLIADVPYLPFRGLMIDSGRHFLPISHIKHVVEAAAMIKLNVIHWHLVDSCSFPTCSDTFPKLCQEVTTISPQPLRFW